METKNLLYVLGTVGLFIDGFCAAIILLNSGLTFYLIVMCLLSVFLDLKLINLYFKK